MESQKTQICSVCALQRPIDEFRVSKQGKRMKTCLKHSKKRDISQISCDVDQWDSFLHEIKTFNHSKNTVGHISTLTSFRAMSNSLPVKNQTEKINVSYTFDLDQLPVNFGQSLETSGEDIFDLDPLNQAIGQLLQIIHEVGGYKFRQFNIRKEPEIIYYYYCSQDSSRWMKSREICKRDRHRMERFDCQSLLKLSPQLPERRLTVTLSHKHHESYIKIQLLDEVLDFISQRCSGHSPSEIYHDLQSSGIPDVSDVAQHQVYYQWQKINASKWKYDPDPFISASIFLASNREYRYAIYTCGNMRGLAIYINDSMNALAARAKELAIDATYGTNNSGMDLYAVLSELDGTGVPLGYLYLGVNAIDQAPVSAVAGSKTYILEQFLQPIKTANFNPIFFGSDKDKSEIAAVRKVWPNASIQLCYWHAKRAIQIKLKDNKRTRTQAHYHPGEAKSLVPVLEICWGSHPTRRPVDHRYGRCQCISSSAGFSELGCIETSTKEERDVVLRMFSRHYNMHSMIPDVNGTYRSAKQIHSDCTTEVYSWCYARNYFRLWAYLYSNWYAAEQWKFWARSTIEEALPVLKTTMIVESHWRKIKHDYLHRFNRPRIDLVVWVLTSRVVPQAMDRMKSIMYGNYRKGPAAWRKAFKRQWDTLRSCVVESQDLQTYHTCPSKWTCACTKFLLSRFLICEHILFCYEEISNRSKFFSNVHRQRQSPFWIDEQLLLRPEHRTMDTSIHTDNDDRGSVISSGSNSNCSEDDVANFEDTVGEDTDLGDGNKNVPQEDLKEAIRTFKAIGALLEEQEAIGNHKFLEVYLNHKSNFESNRILLDEINQRKRQRNMPATWSRNKHPATMYYK